jgi:hypothetical protein
MALRIVLAAAIAMAQFVRVAVLKCRGDHRVFSNPGMSLNGGDLTKRRKAVEGLKAVV